MSERIWAWEYAGAEGNEGQWRSSKGACPSQAYVICEYLRADHVADMLKAEREKALREAASLSWLCFHRCAVEVDVVTAEDILALISEDKTDE